MNAIIIIPAFNESKVISKVISTLPQKIKGISRLDCLVVDDGSTDNTYSIASKSKAIVLRHMINRGTGAATRTGMEYAKNKNYDLLVTFDADGQHSPDDIEKLVEPIINKKADLVIGSRLKVSQKMPKDRLLLNWGANLITFFLYGVFSTDTQSGFKAFSKKAMEKIEISSNRMEFSSEILLEASRYTLRVTEVPIKAIYTRYSKAKGQKNTNAFPVIVRILTKFLR